MSFIYLWPKNRQKASNAMKARRSMKKQFIIPFLSLGLVFCSCSTISQSESGSRAQNGGNFQINGFVQEGNTFSTKVNNDVETFSYLDKVTVPTGATWTMYKDVSGSIEIPTKTVTLEVGDNSFYILVTLSSGESDFYTTLIRRLDMFTVSFVLKNNDVFETQNVQEESKATEPNNEPVISGYDFKGWDYDFDSPVTGDIRILGIWDAHVLTITFDVNGGDELSQTEITVAFGDFVSLPSPTKLGHDFAGWYDGNRRVDSGNWNIDKDTNLQAHWSAKTYMVTVSQSTNCSVTTSSRSKYGDKLNIELNPFSATGYEYINPVISIYSSYTLNEDTLITRVSQNPYDYVMSDYYYSSIYISASYSKEPLKFEITLDANGGFFDSDSNKTMCSFNHSYGTSENLTDAYTTVNRIGYTFEGWFDSNDNQITNIEANSMQKLTFYAKWAIGKYLVEFDKDLPIYLTLDYGYNNLKEVVEYKSGDLVNEVIDIKRDGYIFDGWYLNNTFASNTNFDFKTALVGDTTLYAHWLSSSTQTLLSTILNNGTTFKIPVKTTSASATYRADESGLFTLTTRDYVGLTNLRITRAGQEIGFDHRKSDNIHTIKFYAVAGDLVTLSMTVQTASSGAGWNYGISLTKQEYIITSKIMISCDPIEVTYNEPYVLPTPIKNGYSFVGWFDADGNQYSMSGTWTTPNSIVLYSRFSPQ